MNDNNMTRITVTLDDLPIHDFDVTALEAMSDEEVEQAALSDPDAQPTPPELLHTFRRPVDVKAIREQLSLTQEQFASTFHLPLTILQDWEQARRQPDQPARILLRLIAHSPELVKRVAAMGGA